MSRVAKRVIDVPAGVTVTVNPGTVRIKGTRGELELSLGAGISVTQENRQLAVQYRGDDAARVRAGATRAHLANMVRGVTQGYERKLELVGVGYRAQMQGRTLNLTLGFSHPVNFAVPEGITIETPSQTEIVVRGSDRQRVGQTAAEIRDIRPPEPYKGKGVRYADEQISLKEGKKK